MISTSVPDERAQAAERLPETVAPGVGLAADGELPPAPTVANVDEMRALVVDAAVALVVERAIRGFDLGAAARAKADAREPTARSDVVAGHTPVGAPVADHAPVVAQAVLINMVL